MPRPAAHIPTYRERSARCATVSCRCIDDLHHARKGLDRAESGRRRRLEISYHPAWRDSLQGFNSWQAKQIKESKEARPPTNSGLKWRENSIAKIIGAHRPAVWPPRSLSGWGSTQPTAARFDRIQRSCLARPAALAATTASGFTPERFGGMICV